MLCDLSFSWEPSEDNRNLRRHGCPCVTSSHSFGCLSGIYTVAARYVCKPLNVEGELDVAFLGWKTNEQCSLRETVAEIVLYVLFVDSSLHFYSLCSQHKCGNVLFDLIDESVWLDKKINLKSRHNFTDCTHYLYMNMCMIHASFENSSCLFSLLNKLTTCYKFCITV